MSFVPCQDPGSGRRAVDTADPEPFAVEVQRRDQDTIVSPRGELDIATVEILRAALDGIESAQRLVLDLRRLSFIDSTGVHLLMALYQRSQRDGFALTLVAPVPPIDRAIRLCGLDATLPLVTAVEGEPAESA
jgi:anti-anti-sigma factor